MVRCNCYLLPHQDFSIYFSTSLPLTTDGVLGYNYNPWAVVVVGSYIAEQQEV